MRTEIIENFPCWALCYVINGDKDCLEDDEIKQIDNYLAELRKIGVTAISVNYDGNGDMETYFSHRPEFGGISCECTDMVILYND